MSGLCTAASRKAAVEEALGSVRREWSFYHRRPGDLSGCERQLAMLFFTHNIALSRHIADNLAVLNKGKIVDYGPTASVLENPSHEYTRALVSDVPKF